MIQRIQSLYLLLTALAAILFVNGEYLILSVFAILISALSLLAIFLFSKRKIQIMLTKVLIVLIIIFTCVFCYTVYLFGSWDYKAVIPALQLLFAVLAYRGMRRDDNLVKSYDRLR
jgi:hypothetical protein